MIFYICSIILAIVALFGIACAILLFLGLSGNSERVFWWIFFQFMAILHQTFYAVFIYKKHIFCTTLAIISVLDCFFLYQIIKIYQRKEENSSLPEENLIRNPNISELLRDSFDDGLSAPPIASSNELNTEPTVV